MKRNLTHTLGDALPRTKIPDSLPALAVLAESRGMRIPGHKTQKRRARRHKKHEGERDASNNRERKTEMSNNTNQQTEQNTTTTDAAVQPHVPAASQQELDALSNFGEQLGALLGVRPQPEGIQWKRMAEDVGVFTAKAGVVCVCAAGLMALAKHMSKEPTSIDSEG